MSNLGEARRLRDDQEVQQQRIRELKQRAQVAGWNVKQLVHRCSDDDEECFLNTLLSAQEGQVPSTGDIQLEPWNKDEFVVGPGALLVPARVPLAEIVTFITE